MVGTTRQTDQWQAAGAMDEGRFGLTVWFRRRGCPDRVRPVWEVEDHPEWRWL